MPDKTFQHPHVALSVSSVSTTPSADVPSERPHLPEGGWADLIETTACGVFEMMLGSTVTRAQDALGPDGDITAMVGLAGGLCGVLSIRCSLETARLLASKMLGINSAEAESAARDALGEIANVVAGSLKTAVPGLEDSCFLSTPTVVMGHNFRVYSLGNSTATVVPLEFEGSPLWFLLDVHH